MGFVTPIESNWYVIAYRCVSIRVFNFSAEIPENPIYEKKKKALFWLTISETAVPHGWEGVAEQKNHIMVAKSRERKHPYLWPSSFKPYYTQGPSLQDGVDHFQGSEVCVQSIHKDTPISIFLWLSRQISTKPI